MRPATTVKNITSDKHWKDFGDLRFYVIGVNMGRHYSYVFLEWGVLYDSVYCCLNSLFRHITYVLTFAVVIYTVILFYNTYKKVAS